MTDYYPPRADKAWYDWGQMFASGLAANFAAYHVVEKTVTDVQAAVADYRQKYDVAVDLTTRTQPSVQAKNDARKALFEVVSPIVAAIKADPRVSNELKKDVGIRPRDVRPTPAPLPTAAPAVSAFVTSETSLRVEVRDPLSPDRRGKPAGMRQIELRMMIGSQPTGDVAAWPRLTLSGRTTIDQFFPDQSGEATVWIACAWVNSRNIRGPFSLPTSIRLAGNGLMAAGGVQSADMKIAA